MLYCDENKKDLKQAYKYLSIACTLGVTFFDQMHKFFCENYEEVFPVYKELKKPPESLNHDDREEMERVHQAQTEELKKDFSDALGTDRMYHKPCGYIEDQQIWMMGVLLKYALKQALHFNHKDFLAALRCDLCPILGNTGLWMLKQYRERQVNKGNEDKKKKARVLIEIIENYIEHGIVELLEEKKYMRMNRYCASKMPDQAVKRSEVRLYSWAHYAPAKWVDYL